MTRMLVAATTLIAIGSPVYADVIFVPSNYPTIQSALNAASNGDQVIVSPGTYNESIDFLGKSVRLRSSGGANVTTIDGTDIDDAVVKCMSGEDHNTILDGFTITGGRGSRAIFPFSLGGGMANSGSSPLVRNCVFTGNMADTGGGMANVSGASPEIVNCVFDSNYSSGFGSFGTGGGGISNTGTAPMIRNCTFRDNLAELDGGGITNLGGNAKIVNCTFIGNDAHFGGGIRNSGASPEIVNCVFTGNTAVYGGGIRSSSNSHPTITNCTLSGNATDGGGGILNLGGTAEVSNCIVWGNVPDDYLDLSGAVTTVTYSNIGGDGVTGEGNTSMDPMFVAPNAENLRLEDASPCIDSGDNEMVSPLSTTDIDGNVRIFNDVVDMGAYEPQVEQEPPNEEPMPCPDFNGDGMVDFEDLVSMLGWWGVCTGCMHDLNGDNVVEFDDLTLLLSHWGECPAE